MVDASVIRKDMQVLASDGAQVGRVDDVGTEQIKLTREGSSDGHHHRIPLSWVARVDARVHLNRSATEVSAIPAFGAAAAAPAVIAGGRSPVLWIAAVVIGLVLLLLLFRSCATKDKPVAEAVPGPAASEAVAVRSVVLPNGRTISVAPNSMNDALQTYLASSEPTPRTFTFDNLNFDTGASAIRPLDEATVAALAGILNAYPRVTARIAGYADARGDAAANAGLGEARAKAVLEALTTKGVAADRLEAVSGGEGNPVATNATTQGRAENRWTDLIITHR